MNSVKYVLSIIALGLGVAGIIWKDVTLPSVGAVLLGIANMLP